MVPIATFLSANFFYRVVFLCKSFCNSSLAALYEWFSHDTKCRQWIKWSVCIWKHSIGAVLRLIYRVGNRAGRVKPFLESSRVRVILKWDRVESSRVESSQVILIIFSFFLDFVKHELKGVLECIWVKIRNFPPSVPTEMIVILATTCQRRDRLDSGVSSILTV